MSEMIQMIKHMPLCVCEASGLGYGCADVVKVFALNAFRAVCARISRKEFVKHSIDLYANESLCLSCSAVLQRYSFMANSFAEERLV